jgi:hypothetical protein
VPSRSFLPAWVRSGTYRVDRRLQGPRISQQKKVATAKVALTFARPLWDDVRTRLTRRDTTLTRPVRHSED